MLLRTEDTVIDNQHFAVTFRPDEKGDIHEIRAYGNVKIKGSFAIVAVVEEVDKVWREVSINVIPYDLLMSIDYTHPSKECKVIPMFIDEQPDEAA